MTICRTLSSCFYPLFYPDQNSNGALKDAVKIVTPLVVIGSCIVGLLLVLLVSKWRHRQRQSEYHENDSLRTSG